MIRTIYSITLLALITMFLTPIVYIFGLFTGKKRGAYIIVRLWGMTLTTVFRVSVKTVGQEKIDFSKPVIYMSNHRSISDIPILMHAIPAGLAFISKDSLAKIPFLAWSMSMVGMVFISRSSTSQTVDVLNKAANDIDRDMNFIIFPEGTRSKTADAKLNPIKKGGFHLAMASKRTIQPVVVLGSEKVIPLNSLAIYPGEVEVRFGKPIPVDENSKLEDLMEAYKSEMELLYATPQASTADVRNSMLASN